MNAYRVEVRVMPREGLLDPQGRAVQSALNALGFAGLDGVRIGRLVQLWVRGKSPEDVERQVRAMCDQLIANPVTEDYQVTVAGTAGATPRTGSGHRAQAKPR